MSITLRSSIPFQQELGGQGLLPEPQSPASQGGQHQRLGLCLKHKRCNKQGHGSAFQQCLVSSSQQ